MDSPSCDTYRLSSLLSSLGETSPRTDANIHDCVKLRKGFSQLLFMYVLFSFNIFLITHFQVVLSFELPFDHNTYLKGMGLWIEISILIKSEFKWQIRMCWPNHWCLNVVSKQIRIRIQSFLSCRLVAIIILGIGGFLPSPRTLVWKWNTKSLVHNLNLCHCVHFLRL